jgi:hypothetical protein
MASIFASLPAQAAAGATSTTYVGTWEPEDASNSGLVSVTLTAPAGYTTVTGVVTNNATFNFRQMRANAVITAVIATVTLASGFNLVAETPLVVPITTNVNLQAGDTIDCQMVQNGTGIVVNVGVVAKVVIG